MIRGFRSVADWERLMIYVTMSTSDRFFHETCLLDYPEDGIIKLSQYVLSNRNSIRQNTSESFKLVYLFFPWHIAPVGQGLLVIEASRSHSDTPQSVGLLWTSDQPDPQTSIWQHTTSMPPAGFEPTIPASERLHIHSLGCTAQVSVIATENSTKCVLIFIVII